MALKNILIVALAIISCTQVFAEAPAQASAEEKKPEVAAEVDAPQVPTVEKVASVPQSEDPVGENKSDEAGEPLSNTADMNEDFLDNESVAELDGEDGDDGNLETAAREMGDVEDDEQFDSEAEGQVDGEGDFEPLQAAEAERIGEEKVEEPVEADEVKAGPEENTSEVPKKDLWSCPAGVLDTSCGRGHQTDFIWGERN